MLIAGIKTARGRHPAGAAPARARHRGMTLVELMVTLVLLSFLLGLAAPNFRVWVRNAQVRTVSDALQNGMRLAQTEAVSRSRQVVFFLTDNAACTTAIAAVANGRYWGIRTVPMWVGEAAMVVQCGVLNEAEAGVTVTGPAAVCFNTMGRQAANAATGVTGGNCTLPVSGINTYDIASAGADRPLRLTLALGGQLRQCDPARALSDTHPDGC
jgi:type IV fimbrial biogenesis protein FimT